MARHKVFVSYHADDFPRVQDFVNRFDDVDDVFVHRGIAMPDDVVNSDNPDYVMSQIRQKFLDDSTVTLVLVGRCTWARKFVDWEVQASLRRPASGPPPNGLLAIVLDPTATQGKLPERVRLNVESGYAKFLPFPASGAQLSRWIEEAFQARRNLASRIQNPRQRKTNNSPC